MIAKQNHLLYALFIMLLTCSCHHTNTTLFTSLPSSKTGIDFANHLEENKDLNILSYIYYYNGAGVAVGDINNDGLPDIYFAANTNGGNKLYLNRGNFKFEDITAKAGVAGTSDWCTGVTMADVNGDGYLDIYVCAVANMHHLIGHNELFINNKNGTFTESSAEYGLNFSGFSTQAVFFDYDHDGDLDCFLINQSEHPNQNISDTSARRGFDANSGERLFRNDIINGKPKFTDVSAQAGIYQSKLCYGLGVAVGDLNNDGWDDIYVGNDFHENDFYYINNGNGTFTESGAKHFKHYSRYSMGNDIADFNNDGQLDVVTADMLPRDEKILKTYGNGEHLDIYNEKIIRNGYQNQYSRNCLQRNNGDGESFSDVGLISGMYATDWSWSPLFCDFDNDGNKDLLITSGIVKRPLDLDFINFFSNIKDPRAYGLPDELKQTLLSKMPDGASHPYLFKGDGALHFFDSSAAWGLSDLKGYFNGAAYADFDNDGREDVVINCLNAPAVLLENNAPKRNWLSLSFQGTGMNSKGIGCKAYLFANGKMQYQQLMLTRGFESGSEARLHFGLGEAIKADSILIVWENQKYQLVKNIAANQQITFKQSDAVIDFHYNTFFPKQKELLHDVFSQIPLNWKHEEDNFNDFNNQYLLPHEESTRGPKLAVADVNRDGLDDIFVCGAKGQAGCLFIQNRNGTFINKDTAIFDKNKNCEGVDAIFFDANGDGFPDLYVVSGGSEDEDGNIALADHLYINDGKGNFNEAINALPSILTNKSCIAVADVNGDGSPDIFVGGLSSQKNYGFTKGSSYLLLNDGKGHFHLADTSVLSPRMGLVTSAAFADVNGDGWQDLIVAGEWMNVEIFINNKGIFKENTIGNSSGLWQSLYVTDINRDGHPDILAGNWGLNSKLHASADHPLKLFVKDYDNNGTTEPIMTYNVNGEDCPFLGKDLLETSLPVLKKQHLTYDEVAGKNVAYLLGDMFTHPSPVELRAETLASACFINDGKGNFTKTNLPDELQLAPIFAFAPIINSSNNLYLAGGNFYDVQPYEGRYDAMPLTLFSFDKQRKKFIYTKQLAQINTEARDLKWINYNSNEKLLIIANNKDSLIVLKTN